VIRPRSSSRFLCLALLTLAGCSGKTELSHSAVRDTDHDGGGIPAGDGADSTVTTEVPECQAESLGCACAWGAPQLLVDSVGSGNNFVPTLAADGLGNAHLFWGEGAPSGAAAWKAARFDAKAATWTKTDGPGVSAEWALLAADAHGNALEVGPAASGQAFSTYDLGVGAWSPPAAMPNGTWPSMAMSPNGSAIAVSGQFVPVQATVYDPIQKTWSEPVTLASTLVDTPALAIDENGNAVIAFIELDAAPAYMGHPIPPTGNGISVCRFDARTQRWSPPAQAYAGKMGYSGTGGRLWVSSRPNGRASIFFLGEGPDTLLTEFDPTTSQWTTAAALPSPYPLTTYPWLLASPSGHTMLVATAFEDDAGTRSDIVSSQLDVSKNAWAPFVQVVPGGTPAETLAGTIAPNGDAVIAWRHYNEADATFSQYTRRFDAAANAWMAREGFMNTDGAGALYVTLSMSAAGSTFASWIDITPGSDPDHGPRRLWVNRWACTKRE
jgi:hypothetical protein